MKSTLFATILLALGIAPLLAQTTEPRRELRATQPFDNAIFSQDGQHILVLSGTQVLVYHTRTGLLLRTIENGVRINDLAIEPNQKNLATADQRGDLTFWNVESGQKLRSWNNFGKPIRKLRFSANGQYVATIGTEMGVQVWSVAAGGMAFSVARNEVVRDLSFSPDNQHIATANANNTLTVWDLQTYHPQFVMKGHRGEIGGVCYSSDGAMLLSTATDMTTRVWNTQKGELLKTYANEDKGAVACFDPAGQLVAVGGQTNTVVWEVASGKKLYVFANKEKTTAVAFHPKETLLLACYDAPVARTWLLKSSPLPQTAVK